MRENVRMEGNLEMTLSTESSYQITSQMKPKQEKQTKGIAGFLSQIKSSLLGRNQSLFTDVFTISTESAQCRIKPHDFVFRYMELRPMCQGTLRKGHTGRQWQQQNPVPCSSCNATKEVDLFGKSLNNCKFDHILSFLDSIEPVQNLCVLSGLK